MARIDVEGDYDCERPPGEFPDDSMLALWFVEYWNPNGTEHGETQPMTWDEAKKFADELFEFVEPEDVEYTIHRIGDE